MPARPVRRRALALGTVLWLRNGTALAQAPDPVTLLPGIPVSAREASLAGASTAMIGYAGSVFTNASGIAPVRIMSLEGGFARLSDTSTYVMGAAAVRLGPVNLGGGARYLRFDSGRALRDNLETVVAGVARVAGIALGVAGDYYAIEDSAGTYPRSLTTDLSATVAFFDIAALAVSVQNIGRIPISGTVIDVPGSVRLGFSLNLNYAYARRPGLDPIHLIGVRLTP